MEKNGMKRFAIRALVVIVFTLVIYFGLALLSGISTQNTEKKNSARTFHGPVGAPYVKGPTSSPPAP